MLAFVYLVDVVWWGKVSGGGGIWEHCHLTELQGCWFIPEFVELDIFYLCMQGFFGFLPLFKKPE